MPNAHEDVMKMTIPFAQLANAEIFVRAHELKCCFFGANVWLAYSEMAEWPGEYPGYLEGSGIILEKPDAESLKIAGNPEKWKIGLC